jgi:hypothetical protein
MGPVAFYTLLKQTDWVRRQTEENLLASQLWTDGDTVLSS